MAKCNLRPLSLVIAVSLLLALAAFIPALAQSDTGQLEEGAALYAENCQVCHGVQGQGRIGATLAKNWPSIRPDLTIENIIANGVPGSVMPAWSETKGGPLREEQIKALVAYILSWETGEPFVYQPPAAKPTRPPITPLPDIEGDPNRGAQLYDENCLLCHGADGQGRVGATLAKDWPAIRPEIPIRSIIANGVPGSVMPAWSQAQGGPLSDQDIADITAFILTLPHISQAAGMPTQIPAEPTGVVSDITGIVVMLILFTLVIALILFAQRKQPQA